MKLIRPWVILLIVITLITVIGVIWFKAERAAGDQQAYRTYQYLSHLRTLDTQLERAILRGALDGFVNYEDIHSIQTRFAKALLSQPDLPSPIPSILQPLSALLNQKQEMTEILRQLSHKKQDVVADATRRSMLLREQLSEHVVDGTLSAEAANSLHYYISYMVGIEFEKPNSESLLPVPNDFSELPESSRINWVNLQHRLSHFTQLRQEYNNTIHELIALDISAPLQSANQILLQLAMDQETRFRQYLRFIVLYIAATVVITGILIATIRHYRNKQTEQRRHATTDHLTGLGNRRRLEDELPGILERAKHNGSQVAVIFVDIDNFKSLNDIFGHAEGDKYLQKVADTMKAAVRKGDIITRFGGDEFIILLEGASRDIAAKVAELVVSNCYGQFKREDGSVIEVGASIGISLFPEDGQTLSEILLQADKAMYRAKHSGKGRIKFHKDLDEYLGRTKRP